MHSQDSNGYFCIFVNNSQLHASFAYSGSTPLTSHCSNLNITDTNWYTLVVNPEIGTDAGSRVLIRISVYDSATAIDQCDLQASGIDNLGSALVLVGGEAGGIQGLLGCLELKVNGKSLNLENVVNNNEIRTDNCGSCDIMPPPCLNGGTCVPLNDYEFNCSCADPYFGDFCGEYC